MKIEIRKTVFLNLDECHRIHYDDSISQIVFYDGIPTEFEPDRFVSCALHLSDGWPDTTVNHSIFDGMQYSLEITEDDGNTRYHVLKNSFSSSSSDLLLLFDEFSYEMKLDAGWYVYKSDAEIEASYSRRFWNRYYRF